LEGTSAADLLLKDFDPSMIFENRLAAAISSETRVGPPHPAVEE